MSEPASQIPMASLSAAPAPLAMDAGAKPKHSCCTSWRCSKERAVSCGLSIGGVACTATAVAAAATAGAIGGSVAPWFALGCTGASMIAHVAEGLRSCALAPEKELEQNVARVQTVLTKVTSEKKALAIRVAELDQNREALQQQFDSQKAANEGLAKEFASQTAAREQQTLALQQSVAELRKENDRISQETERFQCENTKLSKEVEDLRQNCAKLQALIDEEKASGGRIHGDVSARIKDLEKVRDDLQAKLAQAATQNEQDQKQTAEKIAQIQSLTKQIEEVTKRQTETQALLGNWEQAMTKVSQQLSSLKPDTVESEIEKVTAQMESLRISGQALGGQAAAGAAAIGTASTAMGRMVRQIQTTVSGLAADIVQKKEFLAKLQEENKKLSSSVQSLQSDLERADKSITELRGINSELRDLGELIKRPDIKDLLQKALSQSPAKP